MILGNNEYKLIALDTNVLREVTLNNDEYRKKLFEKFVLCEDKYAFCFSIYNILELKPYRDIFNSFIDFFSLIPALLIYPYSSILKKEAECYRTKLEFEIDNDIANAFSALGSNRSYDFREFINGLLDNQEMMTIISNELHQLPIVAKEWNCQRDESIKLLKRSGYPLNMVDDKFYKAQEEVTVIKDLKLHNIELLNNSEYKSFLAARVMEFSQFNRVHMTKKEITANDVVDVELSAMAAYIDVVITEKFQANVYKKAKSFIAELSQLEIYTLKDLR